MNRKNILKAFQIGNRILFIIGFVGSIVLFLIAKPISSLIGSERAYLGILFLSPTIFFTSILAGYRGLFQGISNMTPIALSQVLEQICNIFISIFCASMLVNNSLELGARRRYSWYYSWCDYSYYIFMYDYEETKNIV